MSMASNTTSTMNLITLPMMASYALFIVRARYMNTNRINKASIVSPPSNEIVDEPQSYPCVGV